MNENVSGLSLTYFDFFPFTSPFYLLLYIKDFFKYFKRQLKPDLIVSILVTTSGELFCGI